MWKVIAGKAVRRKLEQIPNPDKGRIIQAIDKLKDNMDLLDIKPMVNRDDYRLRVGKWRLIFELREEEEIIFIRALDSRGGIYKNKNQ